MHVTCYKPAPTPIGCVSQNRMRPYFFDGPMYPHRGACRGLAAVDVTENRDEMLTFGIYVRFRVGSRQDCWPRSEKTLNSSASLRADKSGFNDRATRPKSRIIPICT